MFICPIYRRLLRALTVAPLLILAVIPAVVRASLLPVTDAPVALLPNGKDPVGVWCGTGTSGPELGLSLGLAEGSKRSLLSIGAPCMVQATWTRPGELLVALIINRTTGEAQFVRGSTTRGWIDRPPVALGMIAAKAAPVALASGPEATWVVKRMGDGAGVVPIQFEADDAAASVGEAEQVPECKTPTQLAGAVLADGELLVLCHKADDKTPVTSVHLRGSEGWRSFRLPTAPGPGTVRVAAAGTGASVVVGRLAWVLESEQIAPHAPNDLPPAATDLLTPAWAAATVNGYAGAVVRHSDTSRWALVVSDQLGPISSIDATPTNLARSAQAALSISRGVVWGAVVSGTLATEKVEISYPKMWPLDRDKDGVDDRVDLCPDLAVTPGDTPSERTGCPSTMPTALDLRTAATDVGLSSADEPVTELSGCSGGRIVWAVNRPWLVGDCGTIWAWNEVTGWTQTRNVPAPLVGNVAGTEAGIWLAGENGLGMLLRGPELTPQWRPHPSRHAASLSGVAFSGNGGSGAMWLVGDGYLYHRTYGIADEAAVWTPDMGPVAAASGTHMGALAATLNDQIKTTDTVNRYVLPYQPAPPSPSKISSVINSFGGYFLVYSDRPDVVIQPTQNPAKILSTEQTALPSTRFRHSSAGAGGALVDLGDGRLGLFATWVAPGGIPKTTFATWAPPASMATWTRQIVPVTNADKFGQVVVVAGTSVGTALVRLDGAAVRKVIAGELPEQEWTKNTISLPEPTALVLLRALSSCAPDRYTTCFETVFSQTATFQDPSGATPLVAELRRLDSLDAQPRAGLLAFLEFVRSQTPNDHIWGYGPSGLVGALGGEVSTQPTGEIVFGGRWVLTIGKGQILSVTDLQTDNPSPTAP